MPIPVKWVPQQKYSKDIFLLRKFLTGQILQAVEGRSSHVTAPINHQSLARSIV
jgi:hypothetical protein